MMRCFQCMKEYNEVYDLCPYCGYEQDTPQKELYFLPQGTMIQERYEIGVSIGSGGFGITYKAWDHTLSKVVAIKEYYPVGLVNRVPGEKRVIIYSGRREKECANGKVRFLEEARNMAKFNTHPNIINVYDFFEENNTAYIIMEFLDGENYKEYIKKQGGRVPVEKAFEITHAVSDALQEVHKSGILHRDISPDNIFICNDGRIKLIDFGAARFSSTEDVMTRSVILKPGFAPPEQYQTKSKQGPWTDVYALGATLYRAITGNVPEESVNRTEEDQLTDPEKFCPDITHNQNNAILRAMALHPELRFQTTAEFWDALSSDGVVRDVGKELKRRKIKRIISIVSVTTAVILGAVICMNILQKKKQAAAILESANISVWIPIDESKSVDEEKTEFEEALAEYMTEYPQITIDVQCFEEKEYESKLREAVKNHTLPTLYDSTCLSAEELQQAEKLTQVFDFLDEDLYYFYDEYNDYFPSKMQLPMAFSMPVVYHNILLDENEDSGKLVDEGKFIISSNVFMTYYNLYENGEDIEDFSKWDRNDSVVNSLHEHYSTIGYDMSAMSPEMMFMEGNSACLISDTARYEEIQKNMAGIYKIEILNEEGMFASFENCFSINKEATADEKAAAVQVLVYLLSDNAQDYRYVQNGNYLPLNKNVYGAYVDINKEFKDLSQGFPMLHFEGENQAVADKWYREVVE